MNIYDLKFFRQRLRKNKKSNNIDGSMRILTNNDKFALVESYKTARSNLMFSMSAKNNKFVVFASYNKGEGKSTSITNMAISVSKLGIRVLLIDADLRRPNIANLLKIRNNVGFSELLGNFNTIEEVTQRNVLPNLDVITAGSIPPNPSELLSSQNLKSAFDEFKKNYDFILIDSPPVGVVTDILMLKDQIAGYVLIVREQRTTHSDIEKMLSAFKFADAPVLGFIKVDCAQKDKKYYNRYYGKYKSGYGYYNEYE